MANNTHSPYLNLAAAMAQPDLASFTAFCSSVDPQTLYDELVNIDLDKKALEERLDDHTSNLEDLYNTSLERDLAQKDLLDLLKEGYLNGSGGGKRFMKVKVEPFDGDTKKLKAFLFNMVSKVKTENDVYEDAQSQLRCYITHLTGKARTQVEVDSRLCEGVWLCLETWWWGNRALVVCVGRDDVDWELAGIDAGIEVEVTACDETYKC